MVCGFGIVFVVLRFTVGGVDVIPDSVGLVLYAVGLWRLAVSSRVLTAASAIAGLAAAVALSFFAPDWLHGSAEDARDLLYGAAVTLAVALGAFGLRPRAAEDQRVARQLLVIAVAAMVVTALFVAGYAVNGSDHDRAVAIISSASVVGLLAAVWYAVLLLACARRSWAQPDPDPDGIRHEHATKQLTEHGLEMRETPGPRN